MVLSPGLRALEKESWDMGMNQHSVRDVVSASFAFSEFVLLSPFVEAIEVPMEKIIVFFLPWP